MKRIFAALLCASLFLASCSKEGGKKDDPKKEETFTVEMYVAVVAGQDQYIKTTANITGTDGNSRSISIDGLSFTASQPSCFVNNTIVKTATAAGVSLKYAKVASETGKKCAMSTVFNLAAGETPTQKVDFMVVTEYTCSSATSSARISNSEQFSKGIAADKVADYISRNSGKITSSCSVE